MRRSTLSYLVLFLLVLTACTPAPEPSPEPEDTTEADIAAIRQLEQDYADAFNSDDMDKQLAIYTDDAIRLRPNAPALVGIDAIRTNLEELYRTRNQEFGYSIDELEVAGNWAFSRATYSYAATVKEGIDGTLAQPHTGKYIAVYQRQPDGRWKQRRLIWNHDELLIPPEQ